MKNKNWRSQSNKTGRIANYSPVHLPNSKIEEIIKEFISKLENKGEYKSIKIRASNMMGIECCVYFSDKIVYGFIISPVWNAQFFEDVNDNWKYFKMNLSTIDNLHSLGSKLMDDEMVPKINELFVRSDGFYFDFNINSTY